MSIASSTLAATSFAFVFAFSPACFASCFVHATAALSAIAKINVRVFMRLSKASKLPRYTFGR